MERLVSSRTGWKVAERSPGDVIVLTSAGFMTGGEVFVDGGLAQV